MTSAGDERATQERQRPMAEQEEEIAYAADDNTPDYVAECQSSAKRRGIDLHCCSSVLPFIPAGAFNRLFEFRSGVCSQRSESSHSLMRRRASFAAARSQTHLVSRGHRRFLHFRRDVRPVLIRSSPVQGRSPLLSFDAARLKAPRVSRVQSGLIPSPPQQKRPSSLRVGCLPEGRPLARRERSERHRMCCVAPAVDPDPASWFHPAASPTAAPTAFSPVPRWRSSSAASSRD